MCTNHNGCTPLTFPQPPKENNLKNRRRFYDFFSVVGWWTLRLMRFFTAAPVAMLIKWWHEYKRHLPPRIMRRWRKQEGAKTARLFRHISSVANNKVGKLYVLPPLGKKSRTLPISDS